MICINWHNKMELLIQPTNYCLCNLSTQTMTKKLLFIWLLRNKAHSHLSASLKCLRNFQSNVSLRWFLSLWLSFFVMTLKSCSISLKMLYSSHHRCKLSNLSLGMITSKSSFSHHIHLSFLKNYWSMSWRSKVSAKELFHSKLKSQKQRLLQLWLIMKLTPWLLENRSY